MEQVREGQSRPQDKTYSSGIRSGIFGMIGNALLFAAKFTVGLLIRSLAVTADAFNNLSDSASSVITARSAASIFSTPQWPRSRLRSIFAGLACKSIFV